MELITYVVLDALITGLIVWMAGRLTAVQIELKEAIICVGVSSLVGFIPSIGWILSIFVFFFLLKKFSEADIWPDLILLVIVSKLLSIVAQVALGGF